MKEGDKGDPGINIPLVSIPQAGIINLKAKDNISTLRNAIRVSIPQAGIINLKDILQTKTEERVLVSIPQAGIINLKASIPKITATII